MSIFKKNVKAIIESSKSEEELLNNLDSLNRPLTNEEVNFVVGGMGLGCNCDAYGSGGDGCGEIAPTICNSTQRGLCSSEFMKDVK